ncbi:T9SS type A sorting domain-containing protein [uncultured Flavobacterium sp.]|uniref:T9SS type A sorting domain-containing protein n=1 Tax=uncultured Flavobacterium sp. TaxID=165435 RepID=UPI0025D84B27|nr:T9SS type A sorting domain-containing protein [uncultured Flavobacterium sp.]
MNKFYALVLSGFCFSGFAQNFQDVTSSHQFSNFFYATSDIADYDNDGDPDILICGAISSDGNGNPDTTLCQLYVNTSGTYAPASGFDVDSRHLGDVAFIDIDNDGKKDIVITGQNYNNIMDFYTYVYRNTGNGFELVQTEPGAIYSSLDAIDFNFDGREDFILNGVGSEGTFAMLHTSAPDGFELSQLAVSGTQNGNLRVADLNGDLLPDLVVMGLDENYTELMKVYLNENGSFSESQSLGTLFNGALTLADFNADGNLDIVVAGSDAAEDYAPVVKVYYNDGTGQFTLAYEDDGVENFSGVHSVQEGDLNNDGYYDFIIAGDYDYASTVKIYLYNPEDETFAPATENTGIYALGAPADIQLFDFDKDNHLDILSTGFDSEDPDFASYTKIFRNTAVSANNKPEPPAALSIAEEAGALSFEWTGASDDLTPEAALQYYFRAGTSPGARDIAYYRVASDSWKLVLAELPENLYWAISSMDASKALSVESEEQVYTTMGTGDNPKALFSVYPNPVQGILKIQGASALEAAAVYSLNGQQLFRTDADSIDFSNYPAGIYIVKMSFADGATAVTKIVRS